jgi:caa(3)-type oxidase subunit IV
MSAHSTHDVAADRRRYWQVFIWLTVLTLFELGVVYLPTTKTLIAVMLVILASTKAALVAAVYMHLANEKATLRWIAITPMVLCVWLVLMLTPDVGSLRRAWTHKAPGSGEAHGTAEAPQH